MDLRDAVSFHQLVLNSEGRTLATQRQYLFHERILLRYLEDEGIKPTLDALNPASVRAALAWYREQDSNHRTRGGEKGAQVLVQILKTFSRFLEREEIIPDDPLRKLRPPTITKYLREPFTQVEIVALWGAAQHGTNPQRDEALLLLLLETGMRIGEATGLTLDRLHLEDRYVIVGARGKGRRERRIPIGDPSKRDGGRTVRAIYAWLKVRPDSERGGDSLFLGREGWPLGPKGASDAIAKLGLIAGVANAIPHRLRHSMATQYLVTNPGDELGLRRVIGHASKEVLADYVHLANSVIAERAGRASLVETWLGGARPRMVV